MKRSRPIRLCIGCGGRAKQNQLLRFTLGLEGVLGLGSGNGRGGYLHRRRECLRAFATSRSGFIRSLGIVLSREMRAHYATLIEQRTTQWSEK